MSALTHAARRPEPGKSRAPSRILSRAPAGPAKYSLAPPIVHEALGNAGQPLEGVTRDDRESRFYHDFSQVRVHTGARAAASGGAVGAEAYTVGKAAPNGIHAAMAPPRPHRRSAVDSMRPVASLAAIPARPAVQRICGECAVEETEEMPVQPRLEVGPVGDRYEREADEIAGQVMAMRHADVSTAAPSVQRACHACSADEPVRVRHAPDKAGTETIEASDSELTSGGSPLPASTRGFFEERMGRDLSDVRVHQGGQAQDLNGSIAARAFTYRNHVWLGAGESAAASFTMAHELAHVMQQTAPGPVRPLRPRRPSVQKRSLDDGDPLKAAATYKTTAVGPQVGEAPPTPTSAPALMSVPTYGSSLPRADTIVVGKDECGSAGSEWVPDAPFGFDFSTVCAKHDACYDKQLGQAFCDYRLLVDAFVECQKYKLEGDCRNVALIYYTSLVATGHTAYKNAAKKSGGK